MRASIAPATARLAEYLARHGGREILECWDAQGEPDPLAARRLAEALRARHAADLGTVLAVQQQAHVVTLRLIEPAAGQR